MTKSKLYTFMTQYWPFLIIIVGMVILYHSSLGMPLTEDEIAAYGIPALKLNYNNFYTLLPWNYDIEDFFGHPPLNTVFFALVLRIFPSEPQSLRYASLFISMMSMFAFYGIGKSIKSSQLGFALVIMWLCHYTFWVHADYIFADNLFHALFLFFVWAYVKNSKKGLIFFGICMILTRETAIIPLVALWGMEIVKTLRREKNQFILFTFLVLAQFSWFFILWLNTGSATPVFHDDNFIFDPAFVLKTLNGIFDRNFIENYWIISLLFIFLGPVKKTFKAYWGFILITLTLIFGLSTVTSSLNRYQMVGISSWIIFITVLFFNREQTPERWLKLLLGLVLGILFIRNFSLTLNRREVGKIFQRRSYYCAKKIIDLNLPGKVKIAGWPVFEITGSYTSLLNFSWPPQEFQTQYVYFNHQQPEIIDFDYFATFGRTRKDVIRFKKLADSLNLKSLPGTVPRESCIIYQRIK